MSVNRYKIKIDSSTATTATTINIPINMGFQIVDQANVINRDFVNKEVEKAINPILDYEKSRFTPKVGGTLVKNIMYDVRFLSATSLASPTKYSEIGISDDDITFGKKRFENSFLTLSFYDTDIAMNNRLVSFTNIFPRLTVADLLDNGLPKPAADIFLTFPLADPIKRPDEFAEGFYMYHYRDEVIPNVPKELFMRATFNNAAEGTSTNMMTGNAALPINDLVNNLYTKYILTRDSTGYFYEVDESYSTNVSSSGEDVTVILYQIQAL